MTLLRLLGRALRASEPLQPEDEPAPEPQTVSA
jgi:hypothetical protein